jgi:hypothetical protein
MPHSADLTTSRTPGRLAQALFGAKATSVVSPLERLYRVAASVAEAGLFDPVFAPDPIAVCEWGNLVLALDCARSLDSAPDDAARLDLLWPVYVFTERSLSCLPQAHSMSQRFVLFKLRSAFSSATTAVNKARRARVQL